MCDYSLKNNLNGFGTIDCMRFKCYYVYKLYCLLLSKEQN